MRSCRPSIGRFCASPPGGNSDLMLLVAHLLPSGRCFDSQARARAFSTRANVRGSRQIPSREIHHVFPCLVFVDRPSDSVFPLRATGATIHDAETTAREVSQTLNKPEGRAVDQWLRSQGFTP